MILAASRGCIHWRHLIQFHTMSVGDWHGQIFLHRIEPGCIFFFFSIQDTGFIGVYSKPFPGSLLDIYHFLPVVLFTDLIMAPHEVSHPWTGAFSFCWYLGSWNYRRILRFHFSCGNEREAPEGAFGRRVIVFSETDVGVTIWERQAFILHHADLIGQGPNETWGLIDYSNSDVHAHEETQLVLRFLSMPGAVSLPALNRTAVNTHMFATSTTEMLR